MSTIVSPQHLLRAPLMLARDWFASHRRPILIVGLPRSGSSWLGNVLATGASMKYYREPFSKSWHPEAEPFQYAYVPAGAYNSAFDAYARRAFSGRIPSDRVAEHLWKRYHRFPRWPGRVLVKEVHAILGAERLEEISGASIVVAIRHPASLAASWRRLGKTRDIFREWQQIGFQFERLSDPALLRDHLGPYQEILEYAQGTGASDFEKVGAIWGAMYRVLLNQAASRGWKVVTHEQLCVDSRLEFKALFQELELEWTDQTEAYLLESTTVDNGKPFDTRRVSEDEVGKWREELTPTELRDTLHTATAFDIEAYPSLKYDAHTST